MMPTSIRSIPWHGGVGAAVLSLVLLVTVGACGGSSPTEPQSGLIEVEARATSFSPADLVITVGSTVRWVNQVNDGHTITPQGHEEWESAVLSQAGDTFEHTFDEVGEFSYFCEPHLAVGMTGIVRVVEP
jgi:plastocyanin